MNPGFTSSPPRPRYLVVKSSDRAGLGDKLRAVVSGIAYARISGRTLFVDWNDTALSRDGSSSFSRLFRLEGLPATDQRPHSDSVRPTVWQGRLDQDFARVYKEQGNAPWDRRQALQTYSFDQSVTDWPEEICVMWDFDQFGAMAPRLPALFPSIRPDDPPERMQAGVLRAHLRVAPDILEAMAPWRERFRRAGTVAGVHVRATDEHFRQRRAPPPRAFLDAAADLLRRRHANALFLATDNRAVQEAFLRRFGPERVFWTEKSLPEPGRALHLDGVADPLEGAREALLDICLLAACDWLVTLENSSFSMAARLFSPLPESRLRTLCWRPRAWQRIWQRCTRGCGFGRGSP